MDRHIAVWGICEKLVDAMRVAAARESLEIHASGEELAAGALALVVPTPTSAESRDAVARTRLRHRGAL